MQNALPHPKPFIRVDGEPIIKRTLRLLRELGHEMFPFVVVTKGDGELYKFEGTHVIELPELPYTSLIHSMSRAVNSVRMVLPVTVLLGDVCWSRKALGMVLRHSSLSAPFVYGRFGPSKETGKQWDERFAVVADASFFGGWSLKENLKAIPEGLVRKYSVPSGDFTEDFDFPHELETVLPNVERLAKEER
jgi:GTP:adenosylcobinamide-phosphate guanylyltransferase